MLGNKGCDAGGPTRSSACPGHMTHKHTALFSWSTTLLFPGCVFEYPRPTAAYTDHTAAVIRLALKWPRCCRTSVQPPGKGSSGWWILTEVLHTHVTDGRWIHQSWGAKRRTGWRRGSVTDYGCLPSDWSDRSLANKKQHGNWEIYGCWRS